MPINKPWKEFRFWIMKTLIILAEYLLVLSIDSTVQSRPYLLLRQSSSKATQKGGFMEKLQRRYIRLIDYTQDLSWKKLHVDEKIYKEGQDPVQSLIR